jgi:hypothetical protein
MEQANKKERRLLEESERQEVELFRQIQKDEREKGNDNSIDKR